jgi:hypothetical protein
MMESSQKHHTHRLANNSWNGTGDAARSATDTVAFEVYIKQFLVPALSPGKVVVLDNLSTH